MDKLENVVIGPSLTIKQAVRAMDENGQRILFVVDGGKLLGVVTDGDVRRCVLRGCSLDASVTTIMNVDPITLLVGHSMDEAREKMLLTRIECVPVVDESRSIVSAIWWMDLFESEEQPTQDLEMPVVIMAGGEGSRLAPFTKVLPKPLMPVGETPIVELIIERFVKHGCDRFYLSVNYKADLIRAYFNDIRHDYELHYLEEDRPLGTAGGLRLAASELASTFFVSNCDVLVDADYADIARFHSEHENDLTLVGSMKHYTIPYGVCDVGDNGGLRMIREKPEYDFLVSTGLALLEPSVVDAIPADRVYHMTDLVNDLVREGRPVGVYPVSERSWLDMGQFEEMQEMLKRMGV